MSNENNINDIFPRSDDGNIFGVSVTQPNIVGQTQSSWTSDSVDPINSKWIYSTSATTLTTSGCQLCAKQKLYDKLLGILGYDYITEMMTFSDDELVMIKAICDVEDVDGSLSKELKDQILKLERIKRANKKKETLLKQKELELDTLIKRKITEFEKETKQAVKDMLYYKNLYEMLKLSRFGHE